MIVVVGGGLAGLVAARDLLRRGHDVVVREARNRVGGRIETVDLAGRRVDVGAAWIGAGQPLVRALADEAGAKLVPTPERGRPRVAWALGVTDPRLRHLCLPWEWLRARRSIDADALRNVFCVEPDEIERGSLEKLVADAGSFARLVGTAGGVQESLVVGGMERLLEPIVSELGDRIELGRSVRTIAEHRDRVVVDEVEAEHVVVAVPPPTLEAIELTGPAAEAAQRVKPVGVGATRKLVFAYDAPFWRERGLNGQAWGDTLPFSFSYDVGDGVLAVFAVARRARAFAGREAVLAALARVLGEEARSPIAAVERDWTNDPWSRGGYGAYRTARDADTQRVVFAGAELSPRWPGYLEGAIESGLRAAARAAT